MLIPNSEGYIPYGFQRCIATARERIPGSIDNDVTKVSECGQQRGNLKDNGYKQGSQQTNELVVFSPFVPAIACGNTRDNDYRY
ncbi:hypothetical protein [Photorhabdus bodei]|uniref:Uncharacterized protein n=1 Tax=Photorhabdus bodei TaxID=2029681 RepID=A0ABX0APJ6_9GAMM|nr:hypothetical protein [Photorhabdus bodei]NDK98269.1 hypothetical protein [Photorhabdus bodei]NDL02520.1 hypothetical protein [Photorhabdus bodei]NDL06594.1 hypothetical protein [Photorhabdus bodei]